MSRRARLQEQTVEIPSDGALLPGFLSLPENARGIVLFAHGSGSGRFSPRNQAVARVLQDSALATLLMDLLMESEAADRRFVFDIGLLSERLEACTHWVSELPETSGLPVGYFGASTGAGAALVAAARAQGQVQAVVSRGGRPDLAGAEVSRVRAPTLLIVGGNDVPVIELNEQALAALTCPKELAIVPGATHLFEEPGALEEVARLARDWFAKYLARS
jgi:putative phosphoribosyl transferase